MMSILCHELCLRLSSRIFYFLFTITLQVSLITTQLGKLRFRDDAKYILGHTELSY